MMALVSLVVDSGILKSDIYLSLSPSFYIFEEPVSSTHRNVQQNEASNIIIPSPRHSQKSSKHTYKVIKVKKKVLERVEGSRL
jgi:hypothetical protein